MKISGVYKITNTVTNDFYIGSSKNIKSRLAVHKCQSAWNEHPNNPLYKDMRKYGVDKFEFDILCEVEPEHLKETEQQFIETLKPAYNDRNANGWDIERYKEYHKSDKYKEYQKEYHKSDKCKEYQKEYHKSDKYKEYQKEYQKEYRKSDKYKEYQQSDKCKEYQNKYHNQLCSYNGETITINTLRARFRRAGIEHPTAEAKKYLL